MLQCMNMDDSLKNHFNLQDLRTLGAGEMPSHTGLRVP